VDVVMGAAKREAGVVKEFEERKLEFVLRHHACLTAGQRSGITPIFGALPLSTMPLLPHRAKRSDSGSKE